MSKTKDEAAIMPVLQYLTDQNRPYSVIDIFNNLHKEYGKTAIMRALDQLVNEQKVKEKIYGKQKVYFVNQDDFPEINEADLKNMDVEISKLTEQFSELQKNLKTKENLLGNLENSLTNEEAQKQLSLTRKEIPALQSRLKNLESNTSLVKPEERKALDIVKSKYYREWQKRKRIANDVLDAILESYPKGKKQLLEEIGIETDEGFNIPKDI